MTPLIRAVIDTAALRANLAAVRARAPGSKVMAVVKANAYGHGLVMTAVGLPGADAFAVARLEEGMLLREAGITQPIILLEGVFSAEQLLEAAVHRFEVVVHDPLQVTLLEAFRGSFRFNAWLKVDTGINRLGFRPEDFPAALARLRALPTPLREVRVLTHLARADERDAPTTPQQVQRFRALTGALGLATSIGNSAGIFGWPDAAGDWVRPGLALYGVSPFLDVAGQALGLKPVMTLESAIIGLRWVPRGESVGYSAAWTAQRASRIAIVAGGYGDGMLRSLREGSPVLIDGRRAPLVGRVSMDMIAVDVTDLPEVHVGTRCLLWGPGLPVEEVAAHAGTLSYEMLCGVRQRVPHEAV
ncbi:MAG TPA: alanine racemase [Steroidobacteraceae bacterium]